MKIVCFDLECTDLKALMGRILCCSFVEVVPETFSRNHHGTPPGTYTFRADKAPWKSSDPIDDGKLAVAIRDELEKYNCVVGWNSKLFDIAFLNARLLKAGHRPFHPQFSLDLMWYAGGSSNRIGSKRLDNVQRFLALKDAKTAISWEDWQRAALGNQTAFKQVVKHCEQDVLVLREAYWRLLPSVATLHR